MIEVGDEVLVKGEDSFYHATVLEIARNDRGKSIFRIAHRINDTEGYWMDGAKVFETDQRTASRSFARNPSQAVN